MGKNIFGVSAIVESTRTISADSCSLLTTLPIPRQPIASFTHLLRILATNDLCYSVEGVNIWVVLCPHLQLNDNSAPTRNHSWYHFCIFHCKTGCWDLWHTVLVFLNTCVRTWENKPPGYLKSRNKPQVLIEVSVFDIWLPLNLFTYENKQAILFYSLLIWM